MKQPHFHRCFYRKKSFTHPHSGSLLRQCSFWAFSITLFYIFKNHLFIHSVVLLDFPGGSDGKASAYNAGDPGSIPGSGRSPGERNDNHSSTLAWKISWTEKPGRLQSMRLQRVGHDWVTSLSFFLVLLLTLENFLKEDVNQQNNSMHTATFYIFIHSANLMKHFCSKSSQQTNSLMRQRGRKSTAL